jgi:hypothetical protein
MFDVDLPTGETARESQLYTPGDAAVVAVGVHPSDEGDGFSDVGVMKFVTVVCSHGESI